MGEERTDHDLLMRLDERLEHVCDDLKEIKEYMASRPCPSQLCQEHSRSIERIETELKIVAGIAVIVVPVVLGVIMWVLGVR